MTQRLRLESTSLQWKSQQKNLWGDLDSGDQSYRAPPGGGTAPRSRICSPTSGAARRFATTDAGRTAGPPVAEEDGAASEASEWESRLAAGRMARGGGIGGHSFIVLSPLSYFSLLLYFSGGRLTSEVAKSSCYRILRSPQLVLIKPVVRADTD